MGWRVVYLTNSEKLSLHLDSLVINKGEQKIKIPLSDIDTLVIEDYKTVLTVKLINRILEYNIFFLVCDDKYMPTGMLMPVSGYFRQAKTVSEQIAWSENAKDIFWQYVIKRKIENQLEILKHFNKSKDVIDTIEQFSNEVLPGDIKNREGLAAKMYFRELFGSSFIRGQLSPVNSALDYGYTIFINKMNRVIASKGFLPYLGIHHRGEYNGANFACDLVEPFRPVIDSWVIENMMQADFLSREDRIELINLLNARILVNGKLETVSNAMEFFCAQIANYFGDGVINECYFPLLNVVEYNDK